MYHLLLHALEVALGLCRVVLGVAFGALGLACNLEQTCVSTGSRDIFGPLLLKVTFHVPLS